MLGNSGNNVHLPFYFRPVHAIATIFAIISLAFYISAVSTTDWVDVQEAGMQTQYGPYRACTRVWGKEIDECRSINNDCVASFSDPIGDTQMGMDCSKVSAVRALSLIALFSTGLSLVPVLFTSCVFNDLLLRLIAAILNSLAAVSGLIAMSLWAAMDWGLGPGASLGYSFALFTAAWVLNAFITLFVAFPSPIVFATTQRT